MASLITERGIPKDIHPSGRRAKESSDPRIVVMSTSHVLRTTGISPLVMSCGHCGKNISLSLPFLAVRGHLPFGSPSAY